ncbi:hypothetical protein ACHAXM_003193 [Skeletonema potamos]
MKTIVIIQLHCILLYLTVLPALSSQTQNRRRKRRGGQSASRSRSVHKISRYDESIRDKWLDILSLKQESTNAVRLDTRQEHYRYESEVLADQLLGLAPVRGGLIKNKPLFLPWTYSFPLATAVAICFYALPLSRIGTFILSFHSSVTPYLMPTYATVRSTTGSYLRQIQAIMHSLPYFLRHLSRIKINPMQLIYKILKKCIILECWRHIWVRVYKLTSYLWRGTKNNAHSAYVRVVPAFIRRGLKSMIQSMIQGHVHGAVGGLVGTFWESTASSSVDIVQDLSNSLAADSLAAAAAAGDSVQSALEATVESIKEEMDNSIAIESAIESAFDSAVNSVIEDGLLDSIDSSTLESAVEALMEDCLDGDCIDAVFDSALEH